VMCIMSRRQKGIIALNLPLTLFKESYVSINQIIKRVHCGSALYPHLRLECRRPVTSCSPLCKRLGEQLRLVEMNLTLATCPPYQSYLETEWIIIWQLAHTISHLSNSLFTISQFLLRKPAHFAVLVFGSMWWNCKAA
jgi:hypothetical protein